MLRLRDIMTTDVRSIAPEASLRDAMELFSTHHISGAPVVAGHHVLGVISAIDILDFVRTASRAAPESTADLQDAWSDEDAEPGDGEGASGYLAELWSRQDPDPDQADDDRPGARRDPLDVHTVADAMTYGIYALSPDAHVSLAAESMRAADVHRLLVMDDGRLVGIVTTMDLVRAVADHRLERRTYVFDRSGGR